MYTVVTAYSLSECMEELSKRIAENESRGERNLIFCEDRLTLIAERAITRVVGGTFLTTVSTFARFLNAPNKTVSKQGSVMAVAGIITTLLKDKKLQCFKDTTAMRSAKCIYETLSQLSSSLVDSDILRESSTLLPDDVLKRKINDLATIYDGYDTFLKEQGLLDESRYLSLLPKAIEDANLGETNVFFLGYTSFTAQALKTIRSAMQNAKHVYGIFCGGEEDIYTNRAMQAFLRVGKAFGEGKYVNVGTSLDGEAEALRRGLFNPQRLREKRTATSAVRIFEAEDKTAEAEYVAVQIRRAMAENNNLHYRDFAVLTGNVEQYTLALKRAFLEYNIPYFIDEKKSLKRHPLAEFILDCFRVIAEGYSPASVQALTHNYFFGNADEYRNYLLKFANYRGGAKKDIKQSEIVAESFDVPTLQACRSRLLTATKNIKTEATGKQYCDAVLEILQDFQIEKQLSNLENAIEDVAQKSYLSQIYDALQFVLDEAKMLTSSRKLKVKEFAAILQDGLQATEISLIPLKADAVFVGDISSSRIEKVDVLFAVGMTEDVPTFASDTAIISDREIGRLAEVKTLLEPTVAEVNLRSRESVCLNLCTFTQALHLSYPLAADGSEPSVSDVFRYVDGIFCTHSGENLTRLKKIPEEEFIYLCSSPVPAVRQLLEKKNEYERKGDDTRKEYSSLYTALDKLSVTEKDDYLQENPQAEYIQYGEKLFFRDNKISPTALEGYFTCPFRHFAERGLKLKEREETAVLAVDTGNFIHELLETTAPLFKSVKSEEEMRELAFQTGKNILQKPVYTSQADTASGEIFADKLLKEGADVVVQAYKQIAYSQFTVEKTEQKISTPIIHGKVDRVDTTDKYIRIVDYKTGSIDDSATSYYTGRKIQMQLYMSALQGERVPAGIFYFPASVQYTETDDKKFQMKGFLNGDKEAISCGDTTLSEGEQSAFFPAVLSDKQRSKHVMEEKTFRDFIDYSTLIANQGIKELKEGFVAPTPYQNSCDYCKFGGMCGFKADKKACRKESSIDTTAIAEIVRKTKEGEDGNARK